MRHEKYSTDLGNMNMRLIKFVIIPTLILCMTMYPAKAYAAGIDVSAGDSIAQEETAVEESLSDPEEMETDPVTGEETITQETEQEDYSTLIYAINESRDDIVRSVLFTGFLIVGCMAAFIIWRFKV